MTDPETPAHDEAEAGHQRFLAHHFDSHQQQFESGKLGMWIFLVTEILFFGGLFCAYAVYRANHPDIFLDGHHFLDTSLGNGFGSRAERSHGSGLSNARVLARCEDLVGTQPRCGQMGRLA